MLHVSEALANILVRIFIPRFHNGGGLIHTKSKPSKLTTSVISLRYICLSLSIGKIKIFSNYRKLINKQILTNKWTWWRHPKNIITKQKKIKNNFSHINKIIPFSSFWVTTVFSRINKYTFTLIKRYSL